MAQKKRRKKRKHRYKSKKWLVILISIAAVLIIVLAAVLIYNHCSQNKSGAENTGTADSGIDFPYTSEDGNLQITALIQFTGPNVDAENADDEDIAGLQVRNISDQYLDEAEVKVRIDDETEYRFLVRDLPAGSETVAFDLTGQSYDGQTVCREIDCTAQISDTSMREDAVQITADGSKLIITNITEQQIDNAVVIYRCTTGDSYIGGISFEIPVSGLAAGESFEYEDSKCLLGTPEAVGVEIN